MGDVGDYWREHREYVHEKKYGKVKLEPEEKKPRPFLCDCGKDFETRNDWHNHMKANHQRHGRKSGHKLVKGPT